MAFETQSPQTTETTLTRKLRFLRTDANGHSLLRGSMALSFLSRTLGHAALSLCLLAAGTSRAADPVPIAAFKGELRTFSPDGDYAVVLRGELLTLMTTDGWKALGEANLTGLSRSPKAVLVDNARQVAALYEVAGGATVLDLLDFGVAPRRLAREKGVPGRTITYGEDGLLRIEGIANYFRERSVVIRRKSGDNTEFNIFETIGYSCTLPQYLALAPTLAAPLTPERAKTVRAGSTPRYGFPNSVNSPASIAVAQSEFATSWTVAYTKNGSHPAHGDKDDEAANKGGFERLHGSQAYGLAQEHPEAMLRTIQFAGGQLQKGQPWKVKLTGSQEPPFDLLQLGAPGFFPIRVAPQGDLVAFSNGMETRIYAASVVRNAYANLDPEVLQDLIMEKVMNALRHERYAEALPYLKRLQELGQPLPESFYFYQIDALDKSGNRVEARQKAEAYLGQFGKRGKFYSKVIAILAKL